MNAQLKLGVITKPNSIAMLATSNGFNHNLLSNGRLLTSSKSTGGGCLSMVLVLIAIPAIISVWSNYA